MIILFIYIKKNNIQEMVVMMRLNKILVSILLLSIFAVGTLNFVDTVEATTQKKFESGSFNTKNPDSGFKKKISYVSYNKSSKDIRVDFYGYKTKNNKKEFQGNAYLSKSGNKIKWYLVDKKNKKSKTQQETY